jgi:tryptophan 2,3-dioxygenase
MSRPEDIVREEGARTDFANTMTYGDHLQLETLLSAQRPLSDDHHEVMFIIQHQTSELWLKLMLHELGAAQNCLRHDDLAPAFKMLTRVSRIMDQLVSAWSVLATLTPAEFNGFRAHLGQASGFQSWQYRCVEYVLGNKNAAMLKPHAHKPERLAQVSAAFEAPSLYDDTLALMARQGLAIPQVHLQRDWRQTHTESEAVEAAWLTVYQAPQQHWDLYQLGEKLVDIEDAFRLWRFRHLSTVQRVIGFKRGTGGTSGVAYLQKMLDVVLFPELWAVRTRLQ